MTFAAPIPGGPRSPLEKLRSLPWPIAASIVGAALVLALFVAAVLLGLLVGIFDGLTS